MRRDQTDADSQPRRNLALNPNMIATAANITLRQNLAPNPRAEYSTGQITARTNLCTNPRGVSTFADYAGAANQTITPNVAITGHPEGIATATRVTYTTGANPGVTFLNPLVSGNTYAISAWVYHETTVATPGSQGFAQSGIISMPTPPAILTGTWQRLTWIYNSTSTNPLGYRVSGQSGAGTGSYLITGVMVELCKTLEGYFDGVFRPALRTNLAPNPQANGITGWSPIGSAAGTTTAPSGEQSHNGTTAIKRVLTADGSAGLKAVVSTGFIEGETVSWSLWFYPVGKDMTASPYWERSTPYTGSGGGSAVVCPANTWTKLTGSVTFTAAQSAGVTFGFGFLISGTSLTGDTFYADEALIERGATLGPYFDGASTTNAVTGYGWRGTVNNSPSYSYDPELVPSWGGTTDNSISRLLGTGMENWAQATNGGIYRTANQAPPIGTYAAAAVTRGFNGDGLYLQDITVTAGTQYTASAWIKIVDAIPTMSSVMRFKDAGGTILSDLGGAIHTSLVVGQWVRVSTTAVAPANATKLQQMWRLYSSSYTPTTFYVSGVLIEASPVMSPYFDGATANGNDYTYGWNGTAHRAVSSQYGTPAAGIITTKSNSGVSVDSKFFGYQTTLEDGSKAARFVAPAGTTNSTWRIAGINSANGWDFSKIKAGGVYTLWFRWRSMGWAAASSVQVQISTGGATNPVIGSNNITMNQTGWQEYRRTFTALRDADGTHWVYISLPSTPSTSTDGIFDIEAWGLYEGTYNGDPIDGGRPLSKWDGTANASTSVGYPPQLADIAGKPLLDYTTSGTYTLDDSFGPTEARTFYTVFENLAEIPTGNPVSPIIQYGDSNLNDTVPNTWVQLRQDANSASLNGTNNLFLRRSGASGLGYTAVNARHVAMWGLDATGKMVLSGNNTGRVVDTPVMSLLHQKLVVATDQPNNKHFRTICYRGEHDAATRAAIMRFLGNKYGANVA